MRAPLFKRLREDKAPEEYVPQIYKFLAQKVRPMSPIAVPKISEYSPICMNQQVVEAITLYHQPNGFLSQLGKIMGEPIGLGEPYATELSPYSHRITFPVRSWSTDLGAYDIWFFDRRARLLTYSGEDPRHPGKQIALQYSMTPPRRLDRIEGFDFPSLGSVEPIF